MSAAVTSGRRLPSKCRPPQAPLTSDMAGRAQPKHRRGSATRLARCLSGGGEQTPATPMPLHHSDKAARAYPKH